MYIYICMYILLIYTYMSICKYSSPHHNAGSYDIDLDLFFRRIALRLADVVNAAMTTLM